MIMNKTINKKKIILLTIQSLLCVLLTVQLCVSAIDIYVRGSAAKEADPLAWIYTQEAAASALLSCLPLFILAVLTTVVAVVLSVKGEERPFRDPEIVRDLIVSRVGEPSEEMKKERRKQNKLHIVGWMGFALCMIPILIYLCIPSHFDRSDAPGLEAVMEALVLHILPWTIIGIGILSVCLIMRDKSILKETELAKTAEKSNDPAAPAPDHRKAVNALRVIVLAAAVTFIVIGIFNGSMTDVLNKAIRICTECIGLG